ncbi:hypothetical protein wTkk_000190 [Wolbachia endosymbiont of Trichogramma kaykai]
MVIPVCLEIVVVRIEVSVCSLCCLVVLLQEYTTMIDLQVRLRVVVLKGLIYSARNRASHLG